MPGKIERGDVHAALERMLNARHELRRAAPAVQQKRAVPAAAALGDLNPCAHDVKLHDFSPVP